MENQLILRSRFLFLWVPLFCACFLGNDVLAQCPQITVSASPTQAFYCGAPANVVLNNTSTGPRASTATYTWIRNGFSFATTVGTGAQNDPGLGVGTYNYVVSALDTSGCTETFNFTVQVLPTPVPNFTFGPNNQCPGTTIVFTNTSTGNIGGTTYLWNFGDGNTSTAANPTHAYSAPGGVFNVTLTMTNGPGCANTVSFPVTTLPAPDITIAGDDGDGNTVYCLAPNDPSTTNTVTFSNTTIGGITYTWDWDDGSPTFTTGSTAPLTHTYTTYGTYVVTMTSTAASGCTAIDSIIVIFQRRPTAAMSISLAENGGCLPHTVCPTNLSLNADQYIWNFGDGTVIVTTSPVAPCHTYTTAGVYNINLTASNNCAPAGTSQVGPIVVDGPLILAWTMSPNPGCAPQTVTFGNTSTGAVPNNNFTWLFGRGPADSLRNVRNPPAQIYNAGTYTVTLIGRNGCGSDTLAQTLIIDTIPIPRIVVTPTIGCTPLTVNVTNNTIVGPRPMTHQWFIDGSAIPNYTTYNIPPQVFTAPPGNAPVIHSIRYVVSNACGSRDTTVLITVHPQTVALFNSTPAFVCQSGNFTFTSTSQGSNLTYAWDFGNGNTATTAGPHTQFYNAPGTYTVSLTVNGFCGPSTVTHTVTVRPTPVANFVANPDSGCTPLTVNFVNNSTLAATYSWNFGAGAAPATSTAFTPPAVTYSTAGVKIITLTVNLNGCTASFQDTVWVFPRPVVAFTAAPLSGCSPLTVVLNNTTATTGGETWAWDFGDGTTSTL